MVALPPGATLSSWRWRGSLPFALAIRGCCVSIPHRSLTTYRIGGEQCPQLQQVAFGTSHGRQVVPKLCHMASAPLQKLKYYVATFRVAEGRELQLHAGLLCRHCLLGKFVCWQAAKGTAAQASSAYAGTTAQCTEGGICLSRVPHLDASLKVITKTSIHGKNVSDSVPAGTVPRTNDGKRTPISRVVDEAATVSDNHHLIIGHGSDM
mmetsp:Transcript_14030/g.40029  ORF Transcript_14030/g.40029 Transcript_14030/m.40029 type:complete len:208 (+) Transcript_14030:1226-1849(+)